MKKLITITIAVPVFNEEKNISYLIRSLFKQNQKNFVLDKIVILCDGSTDRTPQIAKNLAKKYPKLKVIADANRQGVTKRTQQLINLNTSEILIFFDGDTLPKNETTISELIRVFEDKKIVLASAALIPIKPSTNFEFILYSWRSIWTKITHDFKNGNNIYNFRGVGLALRKSFSKTIKLPKTISGASSHYIYLSAKKRNKRTAFCKKSIINYRLATSLTDYLLQVNRGQKDGKILKKIFPLIYNTEYEIPFRLRLNSIKKNIVESPLDTVIGFAFHLFLPLLNRKPNPSDANGIWKTAISTKNLIKML